jgi:dihydropteroate synthase
MGIVNVTPDSFSDGGRFVDPEAAIRRAAAMIEDGADIIDIGGESTRPGSTPVSWEEEWSRVEPVLRGLSPIVAGSVPISIDTYHHETAERAVSLGATIVNCVYPEPILDMLQICAKNGAELVIPAKSLGSVPKDLGSVPIYLDPMVGFGTTREEDLALLRSVRDLAQKGRVLVGASRKRIVRALAGEESTATLLGGDIAIAIWCAANGASVVRVHDVREVAQALRVYRKI